METRSFIKLRLTALTMLVCLLLAFALSFGLLVMGPVISEELGEALGLEGVFGWIWWTAEWPILLLGLLSVFAAVLYLGPNVDHPRWRFLTPGSVVAVTVWLVASGLFAVYVSLFGSYNKAWGSLAAVIILLTWLWLSALALLLGAEINAEAERSRELRQGQPAELEHSGAREGLTVDAATLAAGPRSSVDRAADFESACGGSIPPGAIGSLLRRVVKHGRRPVSATPLASRGRSHEGRSDGSRPCR